MNEMKSQKVLLAFLISGIMSASGATAQTTPPPPPTSASLKLDTSQLLREASKLDGSDKKFTKALEAYAKSKNNESKEALDKAADELRASLTSFDFQVKKIDKKIKGYEEGITDVKKDVKKIVPKNEQSSFTPGLMNELQKRLQERNK